MLQKLLGPCRSRIGRASYAECFHVPSDNDAAADLWWQSKTALSPDPARRWPCGTGAGGTTDPTSAVDSLHHFRYWAAGHSATRHGPLTVPDGHLDIIKGGIALGGWFMNAHRTALVLFALTLGVVIAVASVTTLERVNTRKVSNDAMPGTMGLAKPHPQLDRAPGEPIVKDR
jgi:hypothetical protein